ncbi:MAG: NAD(P)-dependent alcohol dehydrogenase [Spirosomataceae bacterium]
MKAIVYNRYGAPDVLVLREVEKPTPKANEILIKIKATAVNSGDWRLRKADPFAVRLFFGLTQPKIPILGGVFSGEIEAVGKDVKRYQPGDCVFGSTALSSGFGAYAEYKCLPEDAVLALKPTNLSHTEAAVIPFGATTALHFLKKAAIQPGRKVLVYGASGAVGSAAVQLAKYFGAQVTGVCSTANVALVKSLGADKVLDYTKEDFAESREKYDVILETVNKAPVSQCLKALLPKGLLILSAAGMKQMMQGAWVSLFGSQKVLTGLIRETAEDMAFLKKLIEEGQLTPVIDRTYSLAQMAEAHAYAEKGHKKGNVAIAV